ncbi:MAG: hypothetical protein FJ319_10980 [SAR202 cluster bacterium]|nr:hypothetical protein [SAR202 cluster bacterium]
MAVYSDIDFGGTCETFTSGFVSDSHLAVPFGRVMDLGIRNIGHDTISSLRLNFTCFGPVRSAPVIGNLTVISGSHSGIKCPNGYTKMPGELNDGAGASSAWLYLCAQCYPHQPSVSYVVDLDALVYASEPSFSEHVNDCAAEGVGYQLINQDLDEGAGLGSDWVYFCYQRSTSGDPVRDVGFIIGPSLGLDEVLSSCASFFHTATQNVDFVSSSLNTGAGDTPIWGCTYAPTSQNWQPDSLAPHLFAPRPHNLLVTPRTDVGVGRATFIAYAYDSAGQSIAASCTPGFGSGASQGTRGRQYSADLTAGTQTTVTCTATSNTLTTSRSFNVFVTSQDDLTPPVITPVVTGVLGPGGWYRSNVAVAWNVADPQHPVSTLGCEGGSVTSDTAGQPFSCEASSGPGLAGISPFMGTALTSAGSLTVRRDTVPPTVTAAVDRPPDLGLWYTANVTVTPTGSDSLSGIHSCTPEVLSADGVNLSAVASCSDNAGNSASATVTGINLDKTAPVVTLQTVGDTRRERVVYQQRNGLPVSDRRHVRCGVPVYDR